MSSLELSIITPCLNRSAFIAEAVESALNQNYVHFEHLIMDGGSTDATLAVLAKYPHLTIFSEKDRGMYDALNKGIQKSRGEIIGLLNSDDLYEPNIFSRIINEFQMHPEIDVVSGSATYFQNNDVSDLVKFWPAVNAENFEYALMRGTPIINAWFFRRAVFERLGEFDQSFLIAADREFQARCLINQVKLQPVNSVFYHYRYHLDSMTINGDQARKEKYLRENLRLANKYANLDYGNARLAKKFDAWKDFILFELAVTHLRRLDLRNFFKSCFSAIQEKPARFFVFLVEIPAGFAGFLYRFFQKLFLVDKRNH
ncbi:MAG: glycosyltransferase [Anaerolineales bacterium]|nr:glycosyltransferase [Anaerolineales bacterium]MCZ2122743.1 glycosyltransferase [Anaerolineales bacterium]